MATRCTEPPTSRLPAVDAVRAVIEQWNRSDVNYAVAHGLEDYPQQLGRDIDVVVSRQHLHAASRAVRFVLEQHGWRLAVQEYTELVQHYAVSPGGTESLIIDLFPGLRWGPVWLVDEPAAAANDAGFRADAWVSFAKRILLHVLVAPRAKFADRLDRLRLSNAEYSAASTRLSQLTSAELTDRLLAAIQGQDVAALEALRPQLRRALIISAVRRAPLRAARTTGQWAAARVSFATTRPQMPTVSIVGPDTVDRSAVLAEVGRLARELLRCSRLVRRQGRPGLLPQFGGYGPMLPRAAAPVRTGYYGLDFTLGHVLMDRRISVDLGLIVYERGVLDMYVDPERHGLAFRWLLRIPLSVVPQPNLVVLLYDDSFRAQAAVPESEKREIERQLHRWLEFGTDRANFMALNVGSDRDRLAPCIVSRLVDLFVLGNKEGGR